MIDPAKLKEQLALLPDEKYQALRNAYYKAAEGIEALLSAMQEADVTCDTDEVNFLMEDICGVAVGFQVNASILGEIL